MTTDNIKSDDSKDEDGRNTDAAGNATENNDDFLRDVHEDGEIRYGDFGAAAYTGQDKSVSGRQVNPNVITVQKDQIVQSQLAETGKEHEAKILGWAGKASTATKNWYNIKYIKPDDMKGTSMSIDLSIVKNLKIKQMKMWTEELYISTKLDFSDAKGDELRKWKELKVYLEVDE